MDIGSLTGEVAIEDQLTDKLTEIANHVKNFAEGFDGAMGSLAIGVGVAAAAITGMVISIVELGDKGSNINDVSTTLDHFAGSAENALEIVDKMREGVLGTVGDFDLMKDASRLLSAGVKLNADQFGELTQAAFVLQNRGLGSTKEMMDLVSSAMITGRTRALAMKLGVVEVKDSTQEFADSLGVEVSQLSAAGQAEGKRIGIMKMLEDANRDAGVQQRDFGEQLEFARAKIENWVDELASAVAASPQVMRAVDAIGNALGMAFSSGNKSLMDGIITAINGFADGVTAAVPYIVDFAEGVKHAWNILNDLSPLLEVVGAGLVGYGTALVLTTGLTTAAGIAATGYAAVMGVLTGEITLATGALSSFGLVLGVFMAAYKLGEWLEKNIAWVRKLSDAVEFTSLIFQGFSSTTAAKIIADEHAAEAAKKHAESMTAQQRASENLNSVWGDGIQIEEKSIDVDNAKYIQTGKLSEAQKKLAEEQKKYTDALKDYTATSGGPYLSVLDRIGNELYEGIAFDHARGVSTETLATIYKTTKRTIDDVVSSEKELAKVHEAANKQAETIASTNRNLAFTLRDLQVAIPLQSFQNLGNVMTQMPGQTSQMVGAIQTIHDPMLATAQIAKNLSDAISSIPATLEKAFTGGGGALGAAKALGTQLAAAILGPLQKNLSNMQKSAVGAGSAFTAALGQTTGLNTAANAAIAVGTGIAGAALAASAWGTSMAAAGVAGSVALGAATAGIGAAAIGVALLIKHFTGLSDSVKTARKDTEEFEKAMGGTAGTIDTVSKAFAILGLKGTDAEAALKALWNTNAGAPAVEKAIADITDKLKRAEQVTKILDGDFHDALVSGVEMGAKLPPALADSIQKLIDMGTITGDNIDLFKQLTGDTTVSFSTMRDIANKYGADLTDLGPKFEAARIGDTAKSVINDFDTLQRGLGDTDEALRVMRKPINDLVNDSIKFGVDIPANMQPWVDQLGKTGQLTDANGDKLTDLSKLKFSTPIETQFDALIKKIGLLIDTLTGPNGLVAGIHSIPTHVTTEVVTVHTDVYQVDDRRDNAYAAAGGIVYAAAGRVIPFTSRGTDTVPAMLTPGETVSSVSDTKSTAASLAMLTKTQQDQAASLSSIRRLLSDQPKAIAVAVQDATLLSPKGRVA